MPISYISTLNREQKVAATYLGPKKNVLLLAGAGTGKTRTLVARAEHLMRQGVRPNRIALLTFTRRATHEMKDRLQQVMPKNTNQQAGPVVHTFHMFCMMMLRRHWKQLKFDTKMVIIDQEDQLTLMKYALGTVKRPEDMPKIWDLMNYYSYARNTGIAPAEWLRKALPQQAHPLIPAILQIFRAYSDRKKARGYMDFDDMLYMVARRLKRSNRIRSYVAGLFDHMLVDEMQDTNHLQWTILHQLAQAGVRLFCVGDDAQSVYAFRGADFQNVHNFVAKIPNAVKLKLELNYRSTQEILDLANHMLAQSDLNYDKKLEAYRGPGNDPQVWGFQDPTVEGQWIQEDISKRHKAGAKWGDHMVLVRTAYQARDLEGFLLNEKIPYRMIGGKGLLGTQHVRDFLSMIRAARSHRADIHWTRYLNLWPRIGQVTSTRLVEAVERCANVGEALNRVDEILGRKMVTDGLRSIARNRKSPIRALRAARKHFDPILAAKYKDEWENRRKDLEVVVKLSEKFKTLTQFLESYTIDPITEKGVDANDGLVTIITTHSAKGAEAPTCYVMGAQPGFFPHERSLHDPEEVEEERRVFYVALTRAENNLILTRTRSALAYGPEFLVAGAGSAYREMEERLEDSQGSVMLVDRIM